jgi:hypothetical protein
MTPKKEIYIMSSSTGKSIARRFLRHAEELATTKLLYLRLPHTDWDVFFNVFCDRNDVLDFGDGANKEHRIIALCFAAAMLSDP